MSAESVTPTSPVFLGVDTGGTFTDFVVLAAGEVTIHKALSTPEAPERAILQGIQELKLDKTAQQGQLIIIHGSTIATNAALENNGARTAFITNHDLGDMLTIGRQARRELYNLQPEIPTPPVPANLCLETGGRLGADGSVVTDLPEQELQQLLKAVADLKPEAVAINLLFSFLDDRYEKMIEQAIHQALPELFVTRSSHVLPEYKEYERGIATWLNAWLGPVVKQYLQSLHAAVQPAPVSVMQSTGGTIDALQAASRAVNLLLSGPAGGLAAARYIGKQIDHTRLMTFDMGGTSTDVSLIDGDIRLTEEGHIGPYPVATSMVDIHTIGAGGGSIAYLDEGGMLQVGPRSAGASPGPACYGQGGTQATVTDANAVLSRLRPEDFLGGRMTLDITAAQEAIAPLATALKLSIEETAQGILTLANEHMTRALRVISVQRGHNPAEFRLCCFGGAGGLHLCDLAENLDIPSALVPNNSGVLSALGMLVAPSERSLSITLNIDLNTVSDQVVPERIEVLAKEGHEQLLAEGADPEHIHHHNSVDLRYQGQSYTLNIPWQDHQQALADFHQYHKKRYGHAMDLPVELVNLRVKTSAFRHHIELPEIPIQAVQQQELTLFGLGQVRHIRGRQAIPVTESLTGPLLITEETSTILVKPGWTCLRDIQGNLLLER